MLLFNAPYDCDVAETGETNASTPLVVATLQESWVTLEVELAHY